MPNEWCKIPLPQAQHWRKFRQRNPESYFHQTRQVAKLRLSLCLKPSKAWGRLSQGVVVDVSSFNQRPCTCIVQGLCFNFKSLPRRWVQGVLRYGKWDICTRATMTGFWDKAYCSVSESILYNINSTINYINYNYILGRRETPCPCLGLGPWRELVHTALCTGVTGPWIVYPSSMSKTLTVYHTTRVHDSGEGSVPVAQAQTPPLNRGLRTVDCRLLCGHGHGRFNTRLLD